MENKSSNIPETLLQTQLAEEEKNYYEALKKDVPFFILKEIKKKIRTLKFSLDIPPSGIEDTSQA